VTDRRFESVASPWANFHFHSHCIELPHPISISRAIYHLSPITSDMVSRAIDTKPSATQTPPEIVQAVTGHEKRLGSDTADEEPQLQLAGQIEQEPHLSASSAHTNNVVPTTKPQFLVIFIALILVIFIALILAFFCVALDNTIIVTAIPRITDIYKTLNDVGW